jgi:acyl-CoA dehydrogenase
VNTETGTDASHWQAGVQPAVRAAAENAAAVDSQARFPTEAYEVIKAQRLLGVMLPKSLGGEGAPISAIGDVCYQLATACASTAMIYAMHQIQTACVMRHRLGNATLEALLRRVSAEQLLLASSTTEGGAGGNIRSSEAPVVYTDGRISLDRQGSVISYGSYADIIVSLARRAVDASNSDQVLIAFPKSEYSLTRLQGWNAMGMRGTCSEGYALKASCSAELIVPESYSVIHPFTMVPTAHLLWGSVWTGVAAGAVTRAQAFIRAATRKANGQMPPGAPQFTKMLSSLRSLRAIISNAMRTYESVMDDPKSVAALEFQSMITLVKVEASELAVAIVLTALRVCGLAGYRTDGEFSVERHLRDVLSSPIMINNDRILANLASSGLLTPVPRSLHAD